MMIRRRRLFALCKKEFYQIYRDPSSILIAFILPVILLFLYGYGINLDSNVVHLAIVSQDSGAAAQKLSTTFAASPYLNFRQANRVEEAFELMQKTEVRGILVILPDFSAKLARAEKPAIQLITDGSEPNIANLLTNYIQGSLMVWLTQEYQNKAMLTPPRIQLVSRFWFNPENKSQHYLIPGSIAIIMTIIGALLTSLVVAREWERGTMEALFATSMSRWEFLISKILPYYILGMAGLSLCVIIATYLMKVPFRGSFLVLFITSSLFLGSALGLGLLISTVTKNQFVAAQAALNAAFLPAVMLSGAIFEINSMPAPLPVLSYFIPARYFVKILQTIFQAGEVWYILILNSLFLIASATFWLGFCALKTRRHLDR